MSRRSDARPLNNARSKAHHTMPEVDLPRAGCWPEALDELMQAIPHSQNAGHPKELEMLRRGARVLSDLARQIFHHTALAVGQFCQQNPARFVRECENEFPAGQSRRLRPGFG